MAGIAASSITGAAEAGTTSEAGTARATSDCGAEARAPGVAGPTAARAAARRRTADAA
jgi:hypothetical protein